MTKRISLWILIIIAAFGGLYAFESSRVPCRIALVYTIGQFDERFGISKADFQAALAEAEEPWETLVRRDLFRYDETAAFPVNLIFDERQARTIESQKLEQELTTVQSKQESIKEKYNRLAAELKSARQDYDSSLAAFEARLKRYNIRVVEWNESDRTDEDEVEWLREEERALERNQDTLEAKRRKVNGLVADVNRYAKEEEKIIDRYNAELDEFTEVYGTGAAFDQGIYSGEGIDIYQFDDRNHLRMVLTHELGHALGLGHVDNPESIMYPMMGEQDVENLALSKEDESALLGVCSVTAWDLLYRDLRKVWELATA